MIGTMNECNLAKGRVKKWTDTKSSWCSWINLGTPEALLLEFSGTIPINSSSSFSKGGRGVETSKSGFMLFVTCCYLVTKLCPTLLQPHGLQPTMLLCPWDYPGKSTGVGCHFLLQGIFLTQGLNRVPCLAGRFFTTEPPGKPYL